MHEKYQLYLQHFIQVKAYWPILVSFANFLPPENTECKMETLTRNEVKIKRWDQNASKVRLIIMNHCVKYARISVFSDSDFAVHGKIWVREYLYSSISYTVRFRSKIAFQIEFIRKLFCKWTSCILNFRSYLLHLMNIYKFVSQISFVWFFVSVVATSGNCIKIQTDYVNMSYVRWK